MRPAEDHSNGTTTGSVLTAGLTLRIGGRRLNSRVHWAHGSDPKASSPLIFVSALTEAADSDPLCRLLCSAAAAVALAIPSPRATDDDYELASLGWAVEHAYELGAHPEQVMVAGQGTGAARAPRDSRSARAIPAGRTCAARSWCIRPSLKRARCRSCSWASSPRRSSAATHESTTGVHTQHGCEPRRSQSMCSVTRRRFFPGTTPCPPRSPGGADEKDRRVSVLLGGRRRRRARGMADHERRPGRIRRGAERVH